MTLNVEAARAFLRANARIIERRLAEFHLDGVEGAGTAAIAGLEAYRNDDGGFGHGLEPDALAPESQPLAVDFAFDILSEIAATVPGSPAATLAVETARTTMPFLDRVSAADGGLSIVFPSVAAHPRADHWGDGVFPPLLNPTAKIVANARALGLDHPWIERGAAFCRTAIDSPDTIPDAHTAWCALRFLETDPDRVWADKAYEELGSRVNDLALFQPMPGTGYGLTPLDLAPSPDSPRRRFFSDESVTAHLDNLEATQLDDGGWGLAWTPPGQAAELAWRGVWSLNALRALKAYGRIPA